MGQQPIVVENSPDEGSMELNVSHEDGYVLAATAGRIDETAEEPFREWLHPLVGQRGTKVILDLSQSQMITSTGLGQLVSLTVHANTCGSQVIVSAYTPFVAEVLGVSKLNRFFELADTVPEAVRRVLNG